MGVGADRQSSANLRVKLFNWIDVTAGMSFLGDGSCAISVISKIFRVNPKVLRAILC